MTMVTSIADAVWLVTRGHELSIYPSSYVLIRSPFKFDKSAWRQVPTRFLLAGPGLIDRNPPTYLSRRFASIFFFDVSRYGSLAYPFSSIQV